MSDSASYQLAQLNVAKMLAPLDDPRMAAFVDALAPINVAADSSPGFVWRLEDESGDATSIRVFDDDMVLVNMSVWESVDALKTFVYRSDHAAVMSRRRDWFTRHTTAYLVLWWVPEGHRPTESEARDRLERLQTEGPSQEAFTFGRIFPPPEE
jgi:hypothetical protein